MKNDAIVAIAAVIKNTWLPIMQGPITVGETHISSYDATRLAEAIYEAGYRKVGGK